MTLVINDKYIMRYTIEPRDRSNLCKKPWIVTLCRKYLDSIDSKYAKSQNRQQLLDTTKKLTTGFLRSASKRVIQKIVETTGDLFGNKTAERIRMPASNSTRKDPRKPTSKQIPQPTEIPKEIYISPEKSQQIIDELKLLQL